MRKFEILLKAHFKNWRRYCKNMTVQTNMTFKVFLWPEYLW